MKIKALLCATMMLATCIAIPSVASAETTYTTPQDLIIDAFEVAVTGVESSTYNDALTYVQSLITTNGDQVLYDNTVIGYWYDTDSDAVYTDDTCTSTVLSNNGADIWEFEPEILSEMLTDFNSKLIENIVPATEDWSKIIGKYDVTLGNTTIPADQWISIEPSTEDIVEINPLSIGYKNASTNIYTGGYVVKDGNLYIQPYLIQLWLEPSNYYQYSIISTTTATADNSIPGNEAVISPKYNTLWFGIKLHNYEIAIPYIALTDTLIQSVSDDVTLISGGLSHGLNIENPADKMTGSAKDGETGIFYITGSQLNAMNQSDVMTELTNFFISQSSSKQQIGNTVLKKRLSKFASLTDGDTIEVTPTTWTIRGIGGEATDFDTYLASQDILIPGEETSIPAVADIEALAFKVILPTSLPIYVDELNRVSVADSATIENASGAAVSLKSIDIAAKPDTGWTLLTTGTPSKTRDAKRPSC